MQARRSPRFARVFGDPEGKAARRRRFVGKFLVLGVVAVGSMGCGRKASEADCQLIIDRNVELQMKAMNIVDPALITKKQEELRAEMKDDSRGDCIGRRVTDAMMDCVRKAKSTDEINQCVR